MGLVEKFIGAKSGGSTSRTTLAFNMSDTGVLIPDAGHALVAAVRCGSGNNINTALGSGGVTDTAGGTWSVIGPATPYASGSNVYLLVCHSTPTYASTDSLTFNFLSSNAYLGAVIGQWPHGVFATIDGTVQSASGASGANRSAPAVTPTASGEEIITAFGCGQTTSGTVALQSGSAFTLLGSTINCGLAEITTPEVGSSFTPVTGAWQQSNPSSGSSAVSVVFQASTVVSADAGADQVVGLGEIVTLHGVITGTGATASWVCTAGTAAGTTLTGVSPTYAPAVIGEDTWELTATDADSNTATSTTIVECTTNIVLVCTGTSIVKVRSVTVKPDGTAA